MSFKLGKYSFAGPYTSTDDLKDRSGVYTIICKEDNEYFLADVGESSRLKTRIENHSKKDCWIKNCKGLVTVFVHYTPFLKQQGRILVEQELRELYQPAYGTDKKVFIGILS
jgi:hypothetical protein